LAAGVATPPHERARNFRDRTEVFSRLAKQEREERKRPTIQNMERKIFWISFTVLGLVADFILPIWGARFASIPLVFVSWWLAYRSGWFE